MKAFDIVLLTEYKYEKPNEIDWYVKNILKEDGLVQKSLENKGLKVARKGWDNPEFDWASSKYLLFRTTWNYFHKFNEFSIWLDRTSKITNHLNTLNQIYWNIDKHYLIDLEKAGVNIPLTEIIEKESKTSLYQLHQKNKWNDTVLKPLVSGSARHTYRLNKSNLDSHEEIFQKLIKNEGMMLQPFQNSIIEKGEISLIVIGGKFRHAVLKIAKKGDFRVQDDFGGSVKSYMPNKSEIEFAEFVISKCNPSPVYARVDIIIDNNNELALAEVELIEPELWFRLNPSAADTLAEVIVNSYF